jgi:ankyrin repeat protein
MDIIEATKQNNLETIIKLIKEGTDLNLQDINGNTALIWASHNGHLEIVIELIKANVNINLQNKNGDSALIWACCKGNIEIIIELIKANANINLQNKNGSTALFYVSGKSIKVTTNLIRINENNNSQEEYKDIIFINSNNYKYIKIIKMLIKNNENIDNNFIKDIEKYNISILKLLINKNFNIGLQYAIKFNKQKDIKYYVELLTMNNLNRYQYEKGLINIILNYYI